MSCCNIVEEVSISCRDMLCKYVASLQARPQNRLLHAAKRQMHAVQVPPAATAVTSYLLPLPLPGAVACVYLSEYRIFLPSFPA